MRIIDISSSIEDSFKYAILYSQTILTHYPFLLIIRRFDCYYTHCQETTLN